MKPFFVFLSFFTFTFSACCRYSPSSFFKFRNIASLFLPICRLPLTFLFSFLIYIYIYFLAGFFSYSFITLQKWETEWWTSDNIHNYLSLRIFSRFSLATRRRFCAVGRKQNRFISRTPRLSSSSSSPLVHSSFSNSYSASSSSSPRRSPRSHCRRALICLEVLSSFRCRVVYLMGGVEMKSGQAVMTRCHHAVFQSLSVF